MYSKNAIFVNDNSALIAKYREMSQFDKEFETAVKVGITNGERPNESATRKETAVMNLRAKEKAKQEVKDEIMIEIKEYIDKKFEEILSALKK